MNYHRYTNNGYSHSSLKKKAKELVDSSEFLSLTPARHQIAKLIGYPNWNAIRNETEDKERDLFFHEGFSNKGSKDAAFKEYLGKNGLKNTLENYREYLVFLFKVIKSTRKETPRALHKTIQVDSFIKEFTIRGSELGPESYLPQNLPSYLLDTASDVLSKFLEDPENTLNDDDDLFKVRAVQDAVFTLLAAKKVIENPNHPNSFKFEEAVVIDALQAYSLHLVCEILNRRTKVRISSPTVETIFDVDFKINATFPEETAEVLRG